MFYDFFVCKGLFPLYFYTLHVCFTELQMYFQTSQICIQHHCSIYMSIYRFFVTDFLLILLRLMQVSPFHTVSMKEKKSQNSARSVIYIYVKLILQRNIFLTTSSSSITKPPYPPAPWFHFDENTLFRLCFHIDQTHSHLSAVLYRCFNFFYDNF